MTHVTLPVPDCNFLFSACRLFSEGQILPGRLANEKRDMFCCRIAICQCSNPGLLRQNTGMQYDIDLDARTLHCPLPILKAKKALSNMQSGQILKITTTDAGAERDFQVFALQTGNTLLRQEKHDGMMFHWLQRR